MAALDEQSVTVPLARAAELVLPQLTTQVTSVLAQREQTTALVEEMLDQGGGLLPRPWPRCPASGVRTGARILLEVGDGTTFPTPGPLATPSALSNTVVPRHQKVAKRLLRL